MVWFGKIWAIFMVTGIIYGQSITKFMSLERDITLENYWATTGHMGEDNTHSVTECADQCLGNPGCQSFFYSVTNKLCQLHSTVIESIAGLVPATDDSRYYAVMPNDTSLASAGPPLNITCPASPMGSPELIQLSDGTWYKYGIRNNQGYTHAAGITVCADVGINMTQLTPAKLSALHYIFANCSAYVQSGEYWVDATNSNAADFFNVNQWTTVDGAPIPLEFWAPNEPKSPDVNHCAALSVAPGYLLVAYPCNYGYYPICEDLTVNG